MALIGLAGAGADVLTGDDVDFSEPPTDVLSPEDLFSQGPRITRTSANATTREAYYISFLAIASVVSGGNGTYSYQRVIPWPKPSQSAADDD
ncbi:hypothetical protein F4801DRAFT_575735 [Xylaria longipes]|nr:hypothetical protein F4801DRAFT_575735 [Xylaria longipes]